METSPLLESKPILLKHRSISLQSSCHCLYCIHNYYEEIRIKLRCCLKNISNRKCYQIPAERQYIQQKLGNTSLKKECFLSGIARITSPPSPQFGQLVHLFRPSKINIYSVFFNSGRVLPPPSFGQCPKENIFFLGRCSLIKWIPQFLWITVTILRMPEHYEATRGFIYWVWRVVTGGHLMVFIGGSLGRLR